VLGAGYFLGLYRRAFLGPVTNPVVADAKDLRPRELAVALGLGLLVLLPGLYPQGVLDLTRASGTAWLARVSDNASADARRTQVVQPKAPPVAQPDPT